MARGALGDLFAMFPDLPSPKQPAPANVRRLRRPPLREELRDVAGAAGGDRSTARDADGER
jgi:hypothetical protein